MAVHNGKYVAYYRVSTQKQGNSGLGLEAQQAAVRTYLNGGKWKLVGEFTEVETGKRSDRPKLEAALALCRKRKATLVIGKLDRLGRKLAFIANLMDSGVDFVAADCPNDDRFMLHIRAAVAEDEARKISERTKAALAVAKARGVVLGGYRGGPAVLTEQARQAAVEARRGAAADRALEYAEAIEAIRAAGVTSASGIARELNRQGIKAVRGGEWQAVQVQHLLRRMEGANQ
jgi:DNA invertase Pin-like site-specific DNA recombinase